MTAKQLSDRILDNWPAKIVCLTLSLMLFLFYRMSTLEERFISVPLVVETNGDLVPASAYPRMVKISLRGESESIYPIQENDVVAYIDLSGYEKEGEFRTVVQTRLKGTALDVEPLEVHVEPAELTLRVEHRLIKRVPITPSFKGYPEAGFEFSGYTLDPSSVDVSGPRSVVEKIEDMVTEPIELAGRNGPFSGKILLVKRNSLINVSGEGALTFSVSINQTTLLKSFEEVPFYFENLAPGLTVETDQLSGTIRLKGTQNDLAEWVLPENALTILCEDITAPGTYRLPVRTIIPPPYEVLDSAPGEVVLTVKRKSE